MNNKLRKELLNDVHNFINLLVFYTDDCNELEMTKLIVNNEIKKYFNTKQKELDKHK